MIPFYRFCQRLTLLFLVGSLITMMTTLGSQPVAAQTEAEHSCFHETDFCISGRIRTFWEQNGGLPVFGLPITPQREEVLAGQPVQVQWFERTRLELYPQNEPPYDVLLGRVGVEALEQQGRDWRTFPTSEPEDGCRFFAETGHNVCGELFAAWRANGLEVDGLPGKSDTDSLALFGLPLSDAEIVTRTAGEQYMVQWFERARLELHSSDTPSGQVLFGLLGSEILQNRSAVQPQPVTPAASTLATAHNRFGFNLYAQLLQQQEAQNIFISPTSAAFALAMTYNGAVGDTQQAMAEALELQGLPLEEVNQASSALLAALQSADPHVQTSIANALWARQGITFEPDFLQRNRDFYQAEVTTLDFTDPASVNVINAWVSEQTNGNIPTILAQIDPELIMLLINAVYFKGTWSIAFDESATTEQPFTLLDGSETQVPMMQQQNQTFPYYQGDGFQAVSIPYGEGRMSMVILLPDRDSSLAALHQQLSAEQWHTWMQQLHETQGTLMLPRFSLEYEAQLQDALTGLGMGVAFDCDHANFTRLYAPGACLSFVKQKSFVEVNEAGTEAAAATVVGIAPTSALPQSFFMLVDRPFFFAISDSETGAVLFLGSVVEP